MSEIEYRIERAIHEGEQVLFGELGDPPNEEAWADLAGMVIGDLADDYQRAVWALREVRAELVAPSGRPVVSAAWCARAIERIDAALGGTDD